ncbi:MAG: RagB/SusD family nutrient uptake outer membrane protein, partial [Flavobacteriaceae bacterium]
MKTFKGLLLTAATVFLFSCSEEFLEEVPRGSLISAQELGEVGKVNTEIGNATVGGIYTTFYSSGVGGTTRHSDFGVKSNDMNMDMLSGDMVLGAKRYGWWRWNSELTVGEDFVSTENYIPWRFLYRVVNLANLVVDGQGGSDVVPETNAAKALMGQAKAARAWAYFNLVHLYVDDIHQRDKLVLPIYTSSTENVAKSSLGEIYNLMEKDLTEAISLLSDFQRSAKFEINADIARGVLAYVYAAQNKWQEVKSTTEEIVLSGKYPIMDRDEVLAGFHAVNNHPGIMWGTDITTDNGMNLLSFWGHIDYYSYSYAGVGDPKNINAELYNAMDQTDVRRNQFGSTLFTAGPYAPIRKFYREGAAPEFRRFGGPSSGFTSDLHYMRVAEFWLLHAEAAAEIGDLAAAQTSLKKLLDLRVDNSSYVDGLSQPELLDEINLQTRIELWGEGK